MENNKKNNAVIVGLLLGIIIMLVVFALLFATNTISFTSKATTNESGTTNTEDNSTNSKIYNADEYISLEDVKLNDKITIKKVKFNHLDDTVTKEFYNDQNEIIDGIKKFFNSNSNPEDPYKDTYNAEHKLEYYINSNILTVLYMIEETNAIGTCAEKKAVTNIDLKNNKVISEEELLSKANTSYSKIVEKYYDKELKFINDSGNTNIEEKYGISYDDFKNNKSKYINMGLEKIPNIIYTYIKDEKIKYDYYTIKVDTLFHSVGKGGCFVWETEELGEYK